MYVKLLAGLACLTSLSGHLVHELRCTFSQSLCTVLYDVLYMWGHVDKCGFYKMRIIKEYNNLCENKKKSKNSFI